MRLIDADEAFRVLSDYYHHRTDEQHDALREALDRVPDAVAIEYIVREISYQGATKQEAIGELVRCKDCKYYKYYSECTCHHWDIDQNNYPAVDEDDYCSYGERRTAESE